VAWLAAGVLRPIHPALGDTLLRFDSLDYYDPQTGLRLDPDFRSPEANIIA
jgi:CRISPR-associated endonuclease/helicase Cas3